MLLPVSGPVGPLDWAEYAGPDELRQGRFGLAEPVGEMLGSDAVREARVLLVPALAVDGDGIRLGRGAGYYDRSLALAVPSTFVIAVVRDEELVRRLPSESHDVPVSAVLTPSRGLVRVPVSE